MRKYPRVVVFACSVGLSALFLLCCFPSPVLGWTVTQQITQDVLDSFSPSAVVDSHGNIHIVWLKNTNGSETEDVYYMAGDGVTWQTPKNISNTLNRSFNPQLAITPNDQLIAVWTELQMLFGIPLGSRLYYATYDLQQPTATWSAPMPLSSEWLSVGVPFLATYNGMVHMVWGTGESITGYADRIDYAVWNGTAWSTPQALPVPSGFLDIADIAFDATGQLHLVWNGNRTSSGDVHHDYEIYYTTLINGSWQTPVNVSNADSYSFFPSLAVDLAGRVHVIWLEGELEFDGEVPIFDRIFYNRLVDGQWLTTPLRLSGISGVFFPSAVADTDGNVHFTWANDTKAEDTSSLFRLHYARWDGSSLSGTIQIVETPHSDAGQSVGAIALPASGWLDPKHQYLVWSGGGSQEASQIFFSQQLPHQVSLADLAPPHDMAEHPALAGNSATDLHAVWAQGTATRLIYYSHWNGIRWSNPAIISQQNFDSTSPEIALGSDGVPHVVWHGYTELVQDQIYYTRMQTTTWLTPTAISGGVDYAGIPDLAVDQTGEIHVVWEMYPQENNYNATIYYRRTVGGYDQWQSIERVSELGREANRPRLALDSAAQAHIVWYDRDSEEVYYSNRTAGSWLPPENVSNSPPATAAFTIPSHAPGIAIDGVDRIHVAWKDTVSGTQLDTIYSATRNSNGWQRATIASQPTILHDMDQLQGISVEVLAQPNGDVHVLWADLEQGKLQIFNSNNLARNTGIPWSSPTAVTPHTPQGRRPVGYVDAEHRLHLLWVNPIGVNQIFYGRIERFDWLKIVDELGRPVPNATVYQNGRPVAESDARGLLFLANRQAGDELVALAPVAEYAGWRAGHTSPDSVGQDWAYRVYLTNWHYGPTGERIGEAAQPPGGEQQLTVRSTSPLILFNLLISLQWAADPAYLEDFTAALQKASDYLFDASNGQMAIGRATIYSDSQFWLDADIQVLAANNNRPNAGVNGLRDPLLNPVRIGRSWSGGQNTFVGGLWTEESAYRTLIHELGHYALGIYDSYFRIEYVDGRFMGLTTAYCTAKSIRTNGQDATNATLMDYQYAASEFADQASDSWSEECTRTHQYIENNGESDWETIVRLFTDRADEKFRLLSPYDDAQWQLQTPRATGVLAGPTALPLQQIPMITTVSPSSTVLTSLLVQGPQQAIQLASVTLYVQKEGYTEAIDQGYTDRMGRILLLGARSGDRVNVLSRNTTYAGEITVIAGVTNTLLLEPTLPQMRASQQNEQPTYYVRLYPGAQNKNINVQLVGPAAGASVNAELSLTGHANGTEVILGYNNIAREYRGNLAPNFSDSTTMLTGLSQMWVIGKDVNDQPIYLTGSLELAILEPGKPQTVVSPDGKFLIFVPANGLPLNNGQTYLLISEHGTFGATTQLQPLSPIYQVRLSGSVAGFAAPTVFALRPNAELTDPNAIDTNNMQIYKFDEATQQWQPLPTIWNQQEQIASTEQLSTGYFALFAPQPVILPTTPTPAMPIQTTPTPITTGIPSETSTPFATATHQATPLASATPGATLTPTMTPKPLATPTPCIADVSCSPSYRIFLPVVAQ